MSNPAPQAVVANPVQAAFDAFKSGKDPEQAVYGASSKPLATPSTEVAEPAPGAALEKEAQQEAEPSSEESSTPAAEAQSAPPADEEEIVVTDDSGTRRRLKVSYSDKAKIKKAYEMAAGMRKAFSERDSVKQRLQSIEKEHADLKTSWNALEEAFGKNGVAGVINLLGGKPDAYEKFVQAEVERRNRYATASPEEKRQMDLQAELEREKAEKKALMDKVQADLQRSEEAKKTAEQKQAESVIYPTFEKYRFSGKLGDSALEQRLDRAIWNDARETLNALPEDAEITPAMVDKAFRESANSFRKAIEKEAATKVQQTTAKRKQAASEAAAAAVQGSMANGAASNKAVSDYMKKSDFGGLFRDVFAGKIKL